MQHIHIIGIGGTFMGGLAAIAQEAGFKVSGCDAKMYPPMSTQLADLGITVHEGFDAEQLNEFPADVYVVGNVAKRGMPVIEAIFEPIDSGEFRDPEYQGRNKVLAKYEDETLYASNVSFGAYTLPDFLKRSIGGAVPLDLVLDEERKKAIFEEL